MALQTEEAVLNPAAGAVGDSLVHRPHGTCLRVIPWYTGLAKPAAADLGLVGHRLVGTGPMAAGFF